MLEGGEGGGSEGIGGGRLMTRRCSQVRSSPSTPRVHSTSLARAMRDITFVSFLCIPSITDYIP